MLRSLRFASGGDMTTEEARNQMVTEKQKIEERKKRFGLELDAEAEKQKMIEREKRFGIPSEEGVADFRSLKPGKVAKVLKNASAEEVSVGEYMFEMLLDMDCDSELVNEYFK
jgi:hypothetical protein